jgi:hypothetical protein
VTALPVTSAGWYIKQIPSSRRFYYTPEQNLAIGALGISQQRVLFPASGDHLTIQGVNRPRGSDDLVLYTPQYDSNTKTDNTGVEVLVEMTRPALVLSGSDPVAGVIRQIRQNAGSSFIPFDHVVISATGSNATNLLSRSQLGASVAISLSVSGSPVNADKTYASIGGGEIFLSNGFVMGG